MRELVDIGGKERIANGVQFYRLYYLFRGLFVADVFQLRGTSLTGYTSSS